MSPNHPISTPDSLSRKNRRTLNFLLAFLGTMVFVYVAIRAWFLDITYDEDWTIVEFSSRSARDILTCSPCNPNSHILNTLLIKFFQSLFGNTLFVARLPNLLSLILFLVFSYKITGWLRPLPRVCLFILLIANPFLLDFFGLARGYGLSIAFVTASVYFGLKYFHQPLFKFAIASISLAALAVLSNFTTLYFFMAIGLAMVFIQLIRWKTGSIEVISIELAIATLLFATIITPVQKLINTKLLYYGGDEGFYQDTLVSLATYTHASAFEPVNITPYLNAFLILSLLIILMGTVDRLGNLRKLLFSQKVMGLALFVVPVLVSVLFVHYLDNLYLIDRTALFLYPLLVIAVGLWANNIRIPWARVTAYTSLVVISLMMIINLIPNLNFLKTVTWPQNSRTTDILTYIRQQTETRDSVRIDGSWPFERSIIYHLKEPRYENLHFVKKIRHEVADSIDYFLFLNRPLPRVGYAPYTQPILGYSRDTLLNFPGEGILLFGNLRKN